MDACGASSSSSPSLPALKKYYDVFLSFRGEDTRNTFTSHLYAALKRKGIETYIDEESLERGEKISPALFEAIQNSKISVIVFSEGYAFSSWCLNELVHIIKCHQENKQMVIPIFYEVDPSHIRKQEKSYGEAFRKHHEHFKDSMDVLQKWRDALTKSAGLSGWDSRVIRPESKLVDSIVEDILEKLSSTISLNSNSFQGLIGMEKRFQQVNSLLSTESPDICIIGLWGMGGIGKTTLANAVYSQICNHFQGFCFLKNVSEESEKCGLVTLQEKLFAVLLREEKLYLKTPYLLDNVKKRLKHTRVFIVLDDVSESKQLEHLVGDGKLFGPRSRILVTTRNHDVIRNANGIEHQVEWLNFNEALELFNLSAFNKGMPPTSDYTELAEKMVDYAGGNPLAIKVLGTHLRSLRSPSKENWESTLKKFKDCSPNDIQKVLRISYDGLHENEKNVFLDIACFFKRMHRDFVEKILNSCNFFTSIGIDILIDRSLITVDPSSSELQMHDLVQEMGREIVRQESKNEGERSRLWKAADIVDVLENNQGTNKIEGIFLNLSEIDEETYLKPNTFCGMCKLRLLKIYDSSYVKKSKVHLQDLEYLPCSLRYLEWHNYPLKSLPRNFKPKNLIELNMPNSQLKQIGVQDLTKLRDIDLSHSNHLNQILDLSIAQNLEGINLQSCTSLLHVPSQILENPNKLIDVNLSYCNKLQSVPDGIFEVASLRNLSLQGLSILNTLPMPITCSLVSLNLGSSGIMSLPSSIGSLKNLCKLHLYNCERLAYLPSSLDELHYLKELLLGGCSLLKEFPNLPMNIECLDIGGTAIKEVPSSSIEGRSHLQHIKMLYCESLEQLPTNIFELRSLCHLNLNGCSNLKSLPEIPEPMESLGALLLWRSGIRELPSSIGHLINVKELEVGWCENLESIPSTIYNMAGLDKLYLYNCPKLEYFPTSAGFLRWDLRSLDLSCSNIIEIPADIKELSRLKSLILVGCKKLRSLPELPLSLEELDASGCDSLEVVLNSKRALIQEFWDSVHPEKYISLFCDCLKLDEDQRHDILIEFQLRVLLAATRFELEGIRDFPCPLCVSFLGNEIPEWFEHRSEGSSIDIELSPQTHNSNFLGFVLCVVASTYSGPECLKLFCEVNLKPTQGDEHKFTCSMRYGCSPDWSEVCLPTTSNSSNVVMFFVDHRKLLDVEDASFVFSFKEWSWSSSSGKYSTKCKVLKCGVHMLYSQELEEFRLNFMNDQHHEDSNLIPCQSQSSSRETIDFATDEPYPKRIKFHS